MRRWFETPLGSDSTSTSVVPFAAEASRSGHRPVSAWKSGAARPREAAPASLGLPVSVCVFWLDDRRFALTTTDVQEVVAIEAIAPVPLAPAAVIGLFNLRGTPVSVVDLAAILELPRPANDAPRPRQDRARTALVLRVEGILVAAVVHEMDLVVPPGRGTYIVAERRDEHPAVKGFLELDAAQASTITVLDPAVLAARFKKLKFR